MANLLGMFLRPVWQEKDSNCTSTEQMLAAIKEVNDKGSIDEHVTIGSAGVKVLYLIKDIY